MRVRAKPAGASSSRVQSSLNLSVSHWEFWEWLTGYNFHLKIKFVRSWSGINKIFCFEKRILILMKLVSGKTLAQNVLLNFWNTFFNQKHRLAFEDFWFWSKNQFRNSIGFEGNQFLKKTYFQHLPWMMSDKTLDGGTKCCIKIGYYNQYFFPLKMQQLPPTYSWSPIKHCILLSWNGLVDSSSGCQNYVQLYLSLL